jgi:hypothetical protein
MKNLIIILLLASVALILKAQSSESTFTDARDGKKYKTVKIGKQTWVYFVKLMTDSGIVVKRFVKN